MKATDLVSKPKDIIIDSEQLVEWCDSIDPKSESDLIQEITLALKATMREKNLTSLTAPQIGYKKRIFCIKFGENNYKTFLNPMIENNSNFQFVIETCSSLPERQFIRPRFAKIKAFYTTPLGKVESTQLVGKAAQVFQHCIDHLDGLLLNDIGLEIDQMWFDATDDERAEVLKAYADALDIKQKELTAEVNENQDLKQINDAIDFIQSVKSGETQLAIDDADSVEKD